MDQNAFTTAPPAAPSGANAPGASGETLPPLIIPDHELLRCIGRGSYGEVWLARNMMGQYRAVKIVYRKSFDNQRPFDRELSGIRKFEPISRSHEGFVDVLHVGIKAGEYFYYVMELGDDETSGQNINPENYSPKTLAKGISQRGKLPFEECLKLGLALSQALAELHKHSLVHRDVKPSNIIFVNGVPKLADIGLVAITSEARSYVGTEGFIPPEGPGAPNADIYGLGKVLYECSTGKDRHDFPELPTLLDKFPEHEKIVELNEIILRACKTEARERYQAAWDMHSDLVVLANGKSVKRLKVLEHRLAAAKKIATVSAVAVILSAVVLYQVYRERRAFLEARQRQIGADVANGNNAIESGDSLGALPYFAEALSLDKNTPSQGEDQFRFASALAQCPTLVQMWFLPKMVPGADFDPGNRHILIAERGGRAQIFDVQTGQAVSPQFGQTDRLRGGAFSPDGSLVATASEDGTACIWTAADGALLSKLEHPAKVLCVNFSPDGKHVITGGGDGAVRIWNVSSQELEHTLTGHTAGVLYVGFSHNGQMIVTTSRDNTARIWNAATTRQIGPPLEHLNWVNHAAFSPDDRELATVCFDHKARVWDLASRREILPAMSHDDHVSMVQFSPDGRFIITAGLDRTARLWFAADHRPVETNPILWHSDRVTYAAFLSDGHRIVTTCTDGTVRIWDLAGSAVATLPLHRIFSDDMRRYVTVNERGIQTWDALSNQPLAPPFNSSHPPQTTKLSPDGRFLLAVSCPEKTDAPRRSVEIFETATGRQWAAPFFVSSTNTNFSLSRDGLRLLAVDGENTRTWNTLSGSPLSPPMASEGGNVVSAGFSPDGSKVALCVDSRVEVRDAVTGLEIFSTPEHEAPVCDAEFSPDGSRLVSCCLNGGFTKCSARIWNTATGQLVGSPLRHNDGVISATFSPDGSRVVTASEDYTAIIWDAKTGRQLFAPLKHKDQVRAAAFSPDGKWIATASSDRTARIWSAATGEPLGPPLRHVAQLEKVRFLADGKRLLTGSNSGDSWIWTLPVEEKPVDNFQKLSCLLTSGMIAPEGASSSFRPDSLKPLWEELRAQQPSPFAVPAGKVGAWCEFAAEVAEAQKQWRAAAFDSQQILATAPGDQPALQRLERLKKYFSASGGSPLAESAPASDK